VESVDGARWLVVTTRGDFERLVRSMSRPVKRPEVPESSGPPTREQAEALAAACRECASSWSGRRCRSKELARGASTPG
jgi:hypothetical protein